MMEPLHMTLARIPQEALRDVFFRREQSGPDTGLATNSDALFLFIWWVSVFFFVLLMALMVYFVFKFRRRPGKAAPVSPAHHTGLEITWSVVPSMILVVIFFWGFWGYAHAIVPPASPSELTLNAAKWKWRLDYPGGATSNEFVTLGASDQIPVMYIPEAEPLRVKMYSDDVLHSFWVPDFRRKFDVFPNRYTAMWIEPEAIADVKAKHPEMVGTFPVTDAKYGGREYVDHHVYCAEYCGDLHSEMAAILRVVPRDVYLMKLKDFGFDPTWPIEKKGANLWGKKCSSCHTIDGRAGTGPTWKNIWGYPVEFGDGTAYTAEQMSDYTFFSNFIRESILEPQKKLVKGYGGLMQSFQGQISEEELDYITQYLIFLSDKKPASFDPQTGVGAAGQ